MTASGVRPSKRTRKDPSDPFADSKSTTTPFEASKCKLVEMLATLPTLRESQKTYILDTHVQFIKLRKTLKNLRNRKAETSVEFTNLNPPASTSTSTSRTASTKKRKMTLTACVKTAS